MPDEWDPDFGISDGTTDESLAAALSNFTLHSSEAALRTAAVSKNEKERINDAMHHADGVNPTPHAILITVKASVALATGQATGGHMAAKHRADPNSKEFLQYLEELLISVAETVKGATYVFKRLKGRRVGKGEDFVSCCFRLGFAEKVFCNRILRSKLGKKGVTIKNDFTLTMSYEVDGPDDIPFEGQVYHCPIIVDFKEPPPISTNKALTNHETVRFNLAPAPF